MAELPVEAGPLVVANLEQAVLDAERVVVVLAERVVGELDVPVRQVLAVEGLDPLLPVRVAGAESGIPVSKLDGSFVDSLNFD